MNFILALPTVLKDYNFEVTTQRIISDDRAIVHFELSDPIFVLSRFDKRVEMFTNEALEAYLQYVECE